MKNYLSLLAVMCGFLFVSIPQAFAEISEAELKAFGQKLYDIHARQAKEEYLELIHPDCPAPISEAIEWTFSSKWLKNEEHDIRIKDVNDAYDMKQLDFKVKPEAALEFQTWTMSETKTKEELVTGFPIAKHKGGLRVIDYPCFEPKEK